MSNDSAQFRNGLEQKQRAAEFWEQYDIPFEHDTAIFARRSGLLRGSSGTGHDARTVIHLAAREEFSEGRLSRTERQVLCKPESVYPENMGERYTDGSGEYRPRVTCQTCLDRMERWEKDEVL